VGYWEAQRPTDFYVSGLWLKRHGEMEKALSDFQKAAQIGEDPRLPLLEGRFADQVTKRNRGIAAGAYNEMGDILQSKESFTAAAEAFSKVLELAPHWKQALLSRGNVRFLQRKYREAIEDYSQALASYPKNPYIYKNRGLAYYCLKNYEKASQDLQRSIELHPVWIHDIGPVLERIQAQK
jgi:tetratricopeptide (TPR) repeat protein